MGGKSFQVPCFETPTRVPFFSRGGASKLYFACRPLSLLLTCSECPPPALISCCWVTLSVVPLIDFPYQVSALSDVLNRMQVSTMKLNAVWGFTSTLSQFSYMAMFIHGFWFGASLVRKGTISAGDIMFVFCACSIATSNLQL